MKKRWIAIVTAVSIVICSDVYTYHSYATTDYDSQIQSIEEKKKAVEQKKKNLQETIDGLESDKTSVLAYIKKLDKKVNEINKSLRKLNDEINAITEKMNVIKAELEIAKAEEQSQYDTMKKRIKYMYENGSAEYLDIIFGANDMGDFLNRTEYIEKISEYDNKMLARFKEKRLEIEEKERKMEEQLDELTIKKDEVNAEQDAVKKLNANKTAELKKYESRLTVTRNQRDVYAKEVAKQEAIVEQLLLKKQKEIEAARKKAEEEARRNNAANPGNPAGSTDEYATAAGEYRWPLGIKGRISSYFGARPAPTEGASTNHKGIDIAVASGTPILASNTGTVVSAAYSSSAGNYIMVYHGNSTYTVYMHCSQLAVQAGDSVIKGQTIGYVGSTGVSTGPHLHFAFSVNGIYVNPLNYVKQ